MHGRRILSPRHRDSCQPNSGASPFTERSECGPAGIDRVAAIGKNRGDRVQRGRRLSGRSAPCEAREVATLPGDLPARRWGDCDDSRPCSVLPGRRCPGGGIHTDAVSGRRRTMEFLTSAAGAAWDLRRDPRVRRAIAQSSCRTVRAPHARGADAGTGDRIQCGRMAGAPASRAAGVAGPIVAHRRRPPAVSPAI